MPELSIRLNPHPTLFAEAYTSWAIKPKHIYAINVLFPIPIDELIKAVSTPKLKPPILQRVKNVFVMDLLND